MPTVASAKIFTSTSSGGVAGAAKRVGTAQNVEFTVTPGVSQEVADAGAYTTKGIVVSEVTCDTIVAENTGVGVSWFQQGIDQEPVDLVLGIIDGKLVTLKECGIRLIRFTSDIPAGKLNGRFEFFGGKPVLT